MTPQGRAIKQAAVDFGNGRTLPFTPCKKGFIPVVGNERKVACPLHNIAREKRLAKEQGKFRKGEIDLNFFWSKHEKSLSTPATLVEPYSSLSPTAIEREKSAILEHMEGQKSKITS